MTDKAEDVIARLERLMTLNTNSASQTRDDALTLIAAQAAEIERLTACVAEYIVQIDEIASQAAEIAALKDDNDMLCKEGGYLLHRMDEIGASQAAEIERLHEQGIHLAKTLIKYLPSNVRQSCDSAELWADIDGILYHD